jgi:hypothetical protein
MVVESTRLKFCGVGLNTSVIHPVQVLLCLQAQSLNTIRQSNHKRQRALFQSQVFLVDSKVVLKHHRYIWYYNEDKTHDKASSRWDSQGGRILPITHSSHRWAGATMTLSQPLSVCLRQRFMVITSEFFRASRTKTSSSNTTRVRIQRSRFKIRTKDSKYIIT